MKTLQVWMIQWALWRDDRGQDLVEYALIASLAAVASGLFLPGISESMETIYSRLASKLVEAREL